VLRHLRRLAWASCGSSRFPTVAAATGPPLKRRFRERKPETLPLVQAFERVGTLSLRGAAAGKHYTKRLAQELEDEVDYRLWEGHDPDASLSGHIQAQLYRVIEILLARRWQVSPAEADELDAARHALNAALNSTRGDIWDSDKSVYRVDPEREAMIRVLREQHACLTRALFITAYQIRQAEYTGSNSIKGSKRQSIKRRGEQLRKELAEGHGPLHEKLRRSINKWRTRGLLPPTTKSRPAKRPAVERQPANVERQPANDSL
jgi:hypothetical protein